jgi:hypothetical protein
VSSAPDGRLLGPQAHHHRASLITVALGIVYPTISDPVLLPRLQVRCFASTRNDAALSSYSSID